jgi:DNA-binding NtrC family response regulator
MSSARILIADDDPQVVESCAELLTHAGHSVDVATTGGEVLDRVREGRYDLVLQDLVFPPSDGLTLLREVKQIRPSLLVVMLSGFASVENVVHAYRAGAFDFVTKPIDAEKLLELGSRALAIREMGEKRRKLAEELESERHRVVQLKQRLAESDPFRHIVGNSPVMARLMETLREVSRTDSTVLITGESGTGKGLAARTIHEASGRAEAPFVEANCVVYSEGLLHSELFGHEKGAFTGADRTKKGRFELARGGTLFLDEIGDITQSTQLLLLRVLQDRTFERVGGELTQEADVRLIAATNRDLRDAIQRGAFRSDLYYRLNVIPLHMPPLREHPEDIPVLAQRFVKHCSGRMGRDVGGFSPAATEALLRHPWPGNVRELQNVVERIVVLCRSDVVGLEDLPAELREGASGGVAVAAPGTLREMERRRVLEALRDANGNKKKAAVALGIHRSTLYDKMRRHGLAEVASEPEERSDDRHELSEPATVTSTR